MPAKSPPGSVPNPCRALQQFRSNGIKRGLPHSYPNMTTSPKTNASDFFDEWSIYDQILTHNYMYHDDIFADVRRFLADRYGDEPFNIIDLGCGSARHLAR